MYHYNEVYLAILTMKCVNSLLDSKYQQTWKSVIEGLGVG